MTEEIANICTVVTTMPLAQGVVAADLIDALVKLMMAGARFNGFWSGEILPPTGSDDGSGQWKLIQRFFCQNDAKGWLESQIYLELFSAPALADGAVTRIIPLGEDKDALVVTAIVTDVRPGMEEQYFAWEERIQRAQARYKGFRGFYLQPPAPGKQTQWATLLKFDTPANLEGWFASPERNELLVEAEKFIKNFRVTQVTTSYPGWIAIDEKTGQSPRGWKTAFLVLLGLYPVVVLLIKHVNPFFNHWPPALVTFFSLVASVSATTFVTMPFFNKAFKWYMYPEAGRHQITNLVGTALIIFLYACSISIFWK